MDQEIKSVLITGANAGIGKEVARQMALRSGVERVYLACRSEAKAKAAKQELERTTGNRVTTAARRLDVVASRVVNKHKAWKA